MKAIIWDEASQGMKFNYEEIPADLWLSVAQEWREKMVEAAAEATEDLMNKYLESGDLDRGRDQAQRHSRPHYRLPKSSRCSVRHGLQEQGRAAHAGRRPRLHAVAGRHSRRCTGTDDDDQPVSSSRPYRRGKVFGAGFQVDDGPVRRPTDFCARLLGRVAVGRVASSTRSAARKNASAGSCRCTPTSVRKSRRFWPATSPPAWALKEVTTGETLCDHRTHIDHAREDDLPGAGDLAGRRAQDQGRPGKDGYRAGPSGCRRSRRSACKHGRRIGPDHHLRHGRAAPGNHCRPHEARVWRGSQCGQAAGGLPRNHPQDGFRCRRQVRSPVGRQGPVRSRRPEGRAARAGQGLRVRRRHQGRRRAARVHSLRWKRA